MKTIQLLHGYETVVDDEDYERLGHYSWVRHVKWGYVYRNRLRGETGVPTCPKLHRSIMGVDATHRPLVDHINGDKLDNRKENLRLCTHAENNCNRKLRSDSKTGVVGVTRHKTNGKFQARIQANGKRVSLGYYDTLEEAVEARKAALGQYHGDFARYSNY